MINQVSSTAATKILKHAKSGVDQGMRNSDFPAEVNERTPDEQMHYNTRISTCMQVMGCLIGHCPETTLKKKKNGVIVRNPSNKYFPN